MVARRTAGGEWAASVEGVTVLGSPAALRRRLHVAGEPVGNTGEFIGRVQATGPSAEAALATLADAIRAAVDEATWVDRTD